MPGVMLIKTKRFGDDRGWFSETYNARSFAAKGLNLRFVQDNQSLSRPQGTLRGLHFQRPPDAQAKLVRCLRGRVFDVAVDLRRGSPSFRQWVGVELSAEGGEQLFIPEGFAHGFLTLEPDCEIAYKVNGFYAPRSDAGIRWNDPSIAVAWPFAGSDPVLSPKDALLPFLSAIESPFTFGEGDEPLITPLIPVTP